jgi:uncharacterized membrane protein
MKTFVVITVHVCPFVPKVPHNPTTLARSLHPSYLQAHHKADFILSFLPHNAVSPILFVEQGFYLFIFASPYLQQVLQE